MSRDGPRLRCHATVGCLAPLPFLRGRRRFTCLIRRPLSLAAPAAQDLRKWTRQCQERFWDTRKLFWTEITYNRLTQVHRTHCSSSRGLLLLLILLPCSCVRAACFSGFACCPVLSSSVFGVLLTTQSETAQACETRGLNSEGTGFDLKRRLLVSDFQRSLLGPFDMNTDNSFVPSLPPTNAAAAVATPAAFHAATASPIAVRRGGSTHISSLDGNAILEKFLSDAAPINDRGKFKVNIDDCESTAPTHYCHASHRGLSPLGLCAERADAQGLRRHTLASRA